MPKPITMKPGSDVQVARINCRHRDSSRLPMPVTNMPTEIILRGPSRLSKAPPIGESTIIVMTIGSSARPVLIAEKPWTFCW